MILRITYTCQRCGGSGIESDPEDFGYAELYERAREAHRGSTTGNSIHTYHRLCELRFTERRLDEYPPEEGLCRECDGTGELSGDFDETTLQTAVALLHRQTLGKRAAPMEAT